MVLSEVDRAPELAQALTLPDEDSDEDRGSSDDGGLDCEQSELNNVVGNRGAKTHCRKRLRTLPPDPAS